jgi:hypothetical protein
MRSRWTAAALSEPAGFSTGADAGMPCTIVPNDRTSHGTRALATDLTGSGAMRAP